MLDRRARDVKFFKGTFPKVPHFISRERSLSFALFQIKAFQFDSLFINCYSSAKQANKDGGL
jgi:hypothetical protein